MNIGGHAAEWMIRHAQQFAYSLNGGRLKDVDAAYLDAYFDELGRCDKFVA